MGVTYEWKLTYAKLIMICKQLHIKKKVVLDLRKYLKIVLDLSINLNKYRTWLESYRIVESVSLSFEIIGLSL